MHRLIGLFWIWMVVVFGLPVKIDLQGQTIRLSSPTDYQVFQRRDAIRGEIEIKGEIEAVPGKDSRVEVRLFDKHNDLKAVVSTNLPLGQKAFGIDLLAPAGGWYRIEAKSGNAAATVVEHVGIGEIFVVAGQSNSANHGEERQETKSGLASVMNGDKWQLANDPQPGASGNGGSFIPAFADAMAQRFGVPIGIVALGAGGTSVREWLPEGVPFPNPPTVTNNVKKLEDGQWVSDGKLYGRLSYKLKQLGTNGFRALLWHQGESDANQADKTRTLKGELYARYLSLIIQQTRKDCGWEIPWFVANASYHTPDDTGSEDIRAAQQALWKVKVALEGPDTDNLIGEMRDGGGKGVHFSSKGLKAHGEAWAEKVGPWLTERLKF